MDPRSTCTNLTLRWVVWSISLSSTWLILQGMKAAHWLYELRSWALSFPVGNDGADRSIFRCGGPQGQPGSDLTLVILESEKYRLKKKFLPTQLPSEPKNEKPDDKILQEKKLVWVKGQPGQDWHCFQPIRKIFQESPLRRVHLLLSHLLPCDLLLTRQRQAVTFLMENCLSLHLK